MIRTSYLGETFMVLMDFLQTAKDFPANFISTILSAIIYAKNCFCSCQKQNCKKVHFD